MADLLSQYEGLDAATLNDMLSNATSYDERSAIRKALRKAKGDTGKVKKTGSAVYRRAGFQAPTKVTIPNSVTGNVLPNKISMENPNKVETPQGAATISYLKSKEADKGSVSAGSGRRSNTPTRSGVSSRTSTRLSPEPRTPDLTREDSEDAKSQSKRTINVDVRRTPTPEHMSQMNGNREASPEPAKESTPEPAREETPEPVREPSPPPREPTPEPPREPTPEPSPPPREPTPEPVREPTPESELEEEEREEREEREASEGEYDEEDEDEDEDEDERAPVSRRGRVGRGSSEERQEYRPGRAAGKEKKVGNLIPSDVLTKKEEGIDGDFRKKLQKASATKIDTRAAFPQARPKGEQVDFRNVLKRSGGPERKVYKSGGAVQKDFRSELKKAPKDEAPPPVVSKKSRAAREERESSNEPQVEHEEQEEAEEEEEPVAEPQEPAEEQREEEIEEEEVKEAEPEEKEEEPARGEDEVDSKPSPVPARSKVDDEDDEREARMAERRRRREERRKELEDLGGSTATTRKSEEEKPVENGTTESTSPREKQSSSPAAEMDSYEARREARRKAREERLKAAAARVEEKQPKMSYREKKAREQLANAKENRKKWENREEESGEKTEAKSNVKKGNTATQQLLAWCQHKTKYYENVQVKDFRQSWSDGLAFCAIMHSFLPDKIPYDDLTPDDPRKNFTIAFEAAEDVGIPRMLDVDDMVAVRIPDSKSIMTFLVTIYQHFNS